LISFGFCLPRLPARCLEILSGRFKFKAKFTILKRFFLGGVNFTQKRSFDKADLKAVNLKKLGEKAS